MLFEYLFLYKLSLSTKISYNLTRIFVFTAVFTVLLFTHTWHYVMSQFNILIPIFKHWRYTVWKVFLRFFFHIHPEVGEQYINTFIKFIRCKCDCDILLLINNKVFIFKCWWEPLYWTEVLPEAVQILTRIDILQLIIIWSSYTLLQIIFLFGLYGTKRLLSNLYYLKVVVIYHNRRVDIYPIKLLSNPTTITQYVHTAYKVVVVSLRRINSILIWFESLFRKSAPFPGTNKTGLNFKFQFRLLNYYSMPNSILFIIMKRFNFLNFMVLIFVIISWGVYSYY